jgi:transcriptional regulator GlxA family with amidase domain
MNTKLQHITNWEEFAKQAKWSVSNLAKQCGVSSETLRRHFKLHMGKTTQTWFAEQRLSEAKKRLNTGAPIKEVSIALGYHQQTNFTRQFKKASGSCPTEQPPNDAS